MPAKPKRDRSRVEKPSAKTLQRGLKLGQEEWDRVLIATVGNLGQASAKDIANAADLDIRRVELSLRRLVKARRIHKITEPKYRLAAAVRSKTRR
jgi:hypothetical protein